MRRPPGTRVTSFTLADEHELAVVSWAAPHARDVDAELLTEAERAVLEGLLAGLGAAQIARERGRTASTVRHQIESIYRKLGVGSRAELLARCTEREP